MIIEKAEDVYATRSNLLKHTYTFNDVFDNLADPQGFLPHHTFIRIPYAGTPTVHIENSLISSSYDPQAPVVAWTGAGFTKITSSTSDLTLYRVRIWETVAVKSGVCERYLYENRFKPAAA